MSTTNKQLEQPAFNSYPNTWGTGPLNSNFGYIDTALGGSTLLNATGLGGTVVTLSAADSRPLTLSVSGSPGGIVTYEIPAGIGGQWIVRNGTSGGYDVRIRSGSATGTYVTIPAGNNLQVSCDGSASGMIRNSTAGVNAAAGSNGQVQYNSAGSLAGSANLAFDGTTLFTAGLNNIGSTVLGDASGDTLTISGATAAIPNGLNIGSNTLYLAPGAQQVGIGTTSVGTNALTVAGVIQSTSGGIKFPDNTVQTTASTGGGGGGLTSITLSTVNLPNITVGGSNIQTLTSNGTFLLGGTLAVTNGGTGATTAAAAFTALAPAQTGASGKYLTSDGTNASWTTLALNTGTTVINGGSSGYVLFNSAGTLGNFALGTGVQTALGVAVGSAGAFVTNGGALGTPASGTLTNCSGLPLSGTTGTLGVANGGTGANLSSTGGSGQVLKQAGVGAAVTVGQLAASDLSNGVSGTGNIVLASGATLSSANLSSPTLTSPALGTPTSGNLTYCTGWPGAGSNSDQQSIAADTIYTTTLTSLISVSIPASGKYMIVASAQCNAYSVTGTGLVYTDFGISSNGSSLNLADINVTSNVNDNTGVTVSCVTGTLSAGSTIQVMAKYAPGAGVTSATMYARLPGTKVSYTRISP